MSALAGLDGAQCGPCTVLFMLRLSWFRLLGFQTRAGLQGKALHQLPLDCSIFNLK